MGAHVTTPVLEAIGLSAGHNRNPVVQDLDLAVQGGEVLALLGPNGAGKTTTLLTLAGVLPQIAGTVRIDGSPTRAPLHRRVREGLALVTSERTLVRQLSVAENIRLCRASRADVLDLFPELEPLLRRSAALLSGGEQQMLALGMALASRPKLLLADEISLGLAPLVVQRLMAAVLAAAQAGTAVLLVEQHAHLALRVASRAMVLSRGGVTVEGPTAELLEDLRTIEHAYLHADPSPNGQGAGADT